MSFQQFEMLDNSRGLMNPQKYTNLATIPTRPDDLLALINQNNSSPQSQFQTFTNESLKALKKADGPDTLMDDAKSEFVGIGLDSSIYSTLEREAKQNGDNYMNAESEDFVNQMRQSIQSYNLESNLFGQTPGFDPSVKGAVPIKTDLLTGVINSLREKEKAKVNAEVSRRRRFVPQYFPETI
tara:strand:- start:240 stop:788 length:549 start_codon:yes stop_codon:yes gene_type:complete